MQKFVLCGLGVLLPLLTFLQGYIDASQAELKRTRTEMGAVQPLQDVEEIFKDLHYFERLTTSSVAESDQQLAQIRTEINRHLLQLSAATTGAVADAVTVFRQRWGKVGGADRTGAHGGSLDDYFFLADSLTSIAREVGDQHQLEVDSDLDSFYLSVLSSIQLPRTVAVLWKNNLIARSARDGLTEVIKAHLAANSGTLKNGLIADVYHSANSSLQADASFFGSSPSLQASLPKSLASYGLAVRACADQSWETVLANERSSAIPISHLCEAAGMAALDLWSVSLSELRKLQEGRIEDLKRGYRTRLLFTSAVFLAAMALAFLIFRRVQRTLQTGIEAATHVAQGQIEAARALVQSEDVQRLLRALPASSRVRDESLLLLVCMHRMVARLGEVRERLNSATPAVTRAASQLGDAIRNLETMISSHADSTTRVSSSAKRISEISQQTAQAMDEATQIAVSSANSATEGQSYLVQIRATMADLLNAGEGLLHTFGRVIERTVQVDDVVMTITRIANRTNLISLNAAIEAEKSGKAAGGFSVIAEEIQLLADQASAAGFRIEHLVQEARSSVKDSAETLGRYTSQAQMSKNRIDEVSDELKRIMDGIQSFLPEFQSVNKGMHNQLWVSKDITRSLAHLDLATRQTARAVSQCESVLAHLELVLNELRSGINALDVRA